jgi:hypothetical protein
MILEFREEERPSRKWHDASKPRQKPLTVEIRWMTAENRGKKEWARNPISLDVQSYWGNRD